jgi:hypothetical protein
MTQIESHKSVASYAANRRESSGSGSEAEEPSPGDVKKPQPDGGKQMDDNIDDKGRRPDGTTQDQPGTEDMPDLKDVEPGSDADAVG